MGYNPEMNVSPDLGPDVASYFQFIIGILRWSEELGRIHTITKVSLYHHIWHYPLRDIWRKQCIKWPIWVKSMTPDEIPKCVEAVWLDNFYWDAKEVIPTNAPELRGKEVDIYLFVGGNHGYYNKSSRSRRGCMLCNNIALVQGYSKKQFTVWTSVFVAAFMAMKHGIDALWGLYYNLRIISILMSFTY